VLCCSVSILCNVGLAELVLAMCAVVCFVPVFKNKHLTKILVRCSEGLLTK
jgi:hypothetical protein